jgi:hypothetical protein
MHQGAEVKRDGAAIGVFAYCEFYGCIFRASRYAMRLEGAVNAEKK